MMIQKDYCEFIYEYDEVKGYHIYPKNKGALPKPKSFFKYYALTDYNVEALTNLYVYASHPKQFNDLFDCNEKLIELDAWEDVRNLHKENFKHFKETYPDLQSACEISNQAYWNILYKKLGLVSLANRYDNYIMWALYAQNNGFCVEFDVNKLPFKHFGPFPMNYTKDIPGPVHIGEDGGFIAMLIQTNIKNEWWKYENEWRLYVPNPAGIDMKYYGSEHDMRRLNDGDEHDRKFKYTFDALRSVILGPKFFEKMVPNSISLDEIDIVCYPEIEKK